MILPLRMSLELIAVKVDLAQFARAVPLGLIVEVRGGRIAAFSACRHGPGPHAVAELHHGDEAVAAGAIPLLRARVGARRERGQRSPLRGGEANGNARSRIRRGAGRTPPREIARVARRGPWRWRRRGVLRKMLRNRGRPRPRGDAHPRPRRQPGTWGHWSPPSGDPIGAGGRSAAPVSPSKDWRRASGPRP